MKNYPIRQTGLTLIEVLVSMLVMALGLLGMAALQANTLKYQLGSRERAELSQLLADFGERVRANLQAAPGAVSSSPYLRNDSSLTWSTLRSATLPTANPDCGSADCNAMQLASYDMANWLSQVRSRLPMGNALVTGSAAQGLTVTVVWQDKDFSGAATTCAASTGTDIGGQSCCPASLAIGDATGVRCANFTVTP